MKIEFGTLNNKIDVTNKLNNIKKIPADCWKRCELFEVDPCPGKEKSVFINNIEYKVDKEIDLNLIKQINIVYFIWINKKKQYDVIINGQLSDLIKSKILDISNLYIEICCEDMKLHNKIKQIIKNKLLNYDYNINIYSINNYEYYGIKKIYNLALKEPDLIYLYFHSKGMTDFYDNINTRHKYEEYLTFNTINNYNNVLNLFNYNTNITHTGFFPSNYENFIWLNFFYAKGTYLITCQNPIVTTDRYYYEKWCGTGKNCCVYNLYKNSLNIKYSISEVGNILNNS